MRSTSGNVKAGDLVRVVRECFGHGFDIGEVVKVEKVGYDRSLLCSGGGSTYWLWPREVELIEDNSVKVEECLSLISNLSAEVARLTKRVELQDSRIEALERSLEDGSKHKKYDQDELLVQRPSRKEIVEQAKADIEALKSERYYIVKIQTNPPFSQAGCNVEFIVNRKKRTVVALLKGLITGRVYERGVAKCAPNDCFNEYIGKAIALRRALGREVPQEYTNAPQPEGVEVGDIVRVGDRAYQTARGRVYSVVGTEDDGCLVKAHNLGRKGRLTWVQVPDITVIDDSDREEYR